VEERLGLARGGQPQGVDQACPVLRAHRHPAAVGAEHVEDHGHGPGGAEALGDARPRQAAMHEGVDERVCGGGVAEPRQDPSGREADVGIGVLQRRRHDGRGQPAADPADEQDGDTAACRRPAGPLRGEGVEQPGLLGGGPDASELRPVLAEPGEDGHEVGLGVEVGPCRTQQRHEVAAVPDGSAEAVPPGGAPPLAPVTPHLPERDQERHQHVEHGADEKEDHHRFPLGACGRRLRA
jgi:hypothetical protein